MDYRDKILSMVQVKPVVPSDVAKVMNTNTLMASAMLSEMTSKGVLKASNMKYGSSPLYYIPARIDMLEPFVNNLNEKDKRVYELLKAEGILQDSKQDALTRVCLRNIKDFANPIEVMAGNQQELFWKYATISQEDAVARIQKFFNPVPEIKKEAPKELSKESQQSLSDKPAEKAVEKQPKPRKKRASSSSITSNADSFFAKHNINVIERIKEAGKEGSYVISIVASVGQLSYFCRIKHQKNITEKDLSDAFVQGQVRKLPVLYVSNGELTKQSEELLKELKSITVRKI